LHKMAERNFGPTRYEGFRPERVLPDGSAVYRNNAIGSSDADIADIERSQAIYCDSLNQVVSGKIKGQSTGGLKPKEINPFPLVSRIPRRWRKPLLTLGALAPLGLAAAICGGGEKNGGGEETPTPTTAPRVEEPIDPRHFLSLPFPSDPQMKLVQGWIYEGKEVPSGSHQAIDYVLGTDRDVASTWKKFPVLAAADGLACQESFDTLDGRNFVVKVKHPNGYQTRNLHMDPQSLSSGEIPPCSAKEKEWELVKKGDQLGSAGDSGTPKGWIHDHFEVRDLAGSLVDPYDLWTTRGEYPDPNFTNGKTCGPDYLWVYCPTGEVLGVKITPTPTPKIADESSELRIARIGQEAPDFTLKNLQEQDVSLSDFAGKPVVVFYYGYNCPPCESDLGKMVDITAQYKDQGLVVLTIASGESYAKHISDKIAPVLVEDVNQPTFDRLYRVSFYGVPTSFFIDREGVLVGIRSGVRSQAGLETDVLAILGGQELVKQGQIDRSLLKLPESPTHIFLNDLAVAAFLLKENPTVPAPDAKLISDLLDEAKRLTDENEEANINEILAKLSAAGRILATDYCAGADQAAFRFLVVLADHAAVETEFYIKEGILEGNIWKEVAESFNPQCEIRQ